MRMQFLLMMLIVFTAGAVPAKLLRATDLSLDTVESSGENTASEPMADTFSLAAATNFLDTASLHWTKSRQCFACHTNFLYLVARPTIASDNTPHQQVRKALEEMVEQRWETSGPRWDAEVVMSAAMLALNDRVTTGKLHPTTRKALDRMWTLQREDGGFTWLKCGWPPMESDDDYGIPIAALAVAAAPDEYASTEQAQVGMAKLRSYLLNNPPPTLHHRVMLLWPEIYGVKLLNVEQRQACIDELVALQCADGGWAVATFGDWKRGDGLMQDTTTSDGYATGLAVYMLRQSGLPASDERLQRGLTWLKTNQRVSGRWFTRSLNKDNKHFLSHAGSAFAVMALTTCGEK